MKKLTIKNGRCWDMISFTTLGNEFLMDDLIRMQTVENFNSPVYSFVIPDNSIITIPDTPEVVEPEFKAPWE